MYSNISDDYPCFSDLLTLSAQNGLPEKAVDAAADPIIVFDRDQKIVLANKAAGLLHNAKTSVIGGKCWELFNKSAVSCERPEETCWFKQVMETGEVMKIVVPLCSPGGETKMISVTASPICDATNEITNIIITLRDIVHEEGTTPEITIKTQQRLAESDLFIKSLLDSLGEGVIVLDPLYRIVEANRKFLEISGRHKADVLGKHCYQISHDFDVPCWSLKNGGHECPSKIAIETGKPAAAIHIHKDEQRRNHYIEINAFPLKNRKGEIFQLIETHTDITDKRLLENKLIQAQKMESIGTLAGGIAHDLNNILTPILGNAELALMRMTETDPSYNEFKEIQMAAGRAANLIGQILAFSRRQILQKKNVNMNDIVENLIKMLNRLIREDVVMKIMLGDELWNVSADAQQLEQVILNLVVNARDAMPGGGQLIIETQNLANVDNICHTCGERMSGAFVLLMVSDTGIGIDSKIMNMIFEPFFTTKATGIGTGLGLSTVHGIMHQHKAHVNFYSEVGHGTTFKVYFPKSEDTEVGGGGGVQQPVRTIPRGKETILVVDDSKSVRGMIEKMLSSCGYTILTAENGEAAMEIFEQHKKNIDLLLTDIVMPAMGGKELAENLLSVKSDLSVLFTSGYSLNAVHEHFVLKKGIEYIQKPLTLENLTTKVRELLDVATKRSAVTS